MRLLERFHTPVVLHPCWTDSRHSAKPYLFLFTVMISCCGGSIELFFSSLFAQDEKNQVLMTNAWLQLVSGNGWGLNDTVTHDVLISHPSHQKGSNTISSWYAAGFVWYLDNLEDTCLWRVDEVGFVRGACGPPCLVSTIDTTQDKENNERLHSPQSLQTDLRPISHQFIWFFIESFTPL